MAIKIIGFNLQVISSDESTVIDDLGSCVIPLLRKGTLQNIGVFAVDSSNYENLSIYTPDCAEIGMGCSDYSIYANTYSVITQYAPLSVIKSTTNIRNNKLKITNPSSGFYAITVNVCVSTGYYSGDWNLYDNNGNLMGVLNSNFGFPLSDNSRIRCPLFSDYAGDIITASSCNVLQIEYIYQHSGVNITGVRVNGNNTVSLSTGAVAWLNALQIGPEPPGPTPSEDDPYGPTHGGPGYSDTGGGPAESGGTGETGTGGLHDDTSDAIPIPIPPSSLSTGVGIFTAYNPSANQLASFAQNLWSGPSSIDDWLRYLTGGDAFNAIIGLHMLPVSPSTGGSSNIKLGNWDTGVSAPVINSQYVQHTFGTIMLPEYWGNAIDYSPYTRIQLALPYIGIVDVDTDDVLGSQNTLTYNIDVLSGAICAMLRCVKGNLSSVIYQWTGSCAVSLPITGANYNGVLSGVIGAAAGIAAISVGAVALGAASGLGAAVAGGAGVVGGLGTYAGSAANTYGSMKGKIQKSSGFSASSGALGIKEPYFIITRPIQSVPESWQADKGYPANISAQLSTLTGYTEVSEINLECSGTEAEKEEIITLLKNGVIF